ncbi:MAG TPA: DUF5696 domain-containing protein [Bryobacteraceae bacterium]|nr:DUF5696 domain-containing protein [Bryobacteraceae bacterium]
MILHRFALLAPVVLLALVSRPCEGQIAPEEWGAPAVHVSHSGGKWTIAGKKNTATLDEKDLSLSVQAGPVSWKMVPSSSQDLRVRAGDDEFSLGLAEAGQIQIAQFQTGYKTGVKITLDGFRSSGQRAPGALLGLRLYLTIGMEGGDEDLDFEVAAVERDARIRELNWPMAMDGREVDCTLLSNDNGEMIPRDWPLYYHPIHRSQTDDSIIQSNLIESWSMSWWGFQKGNSAMMIIVETPDDAAYTFSHPPGGPTSIGPTWRPQLGRFGYVRSLRMAFFPSGNYVTLAKRYRRYVIESGQFVSLKDKIARDPLVAHLIGTPTMGVSILRNLNPTGPNYDKQNPEKNRHLTTYAENIKRLRELKAQGWNSLNVTMSGWPNQGYDRQHPDALPPNQEAGGWEGMKAFFDTCKELGYTCWLHDQYRDYYPDAPSFSRDYAVQEEDSITPTTRFPGTRFHPHDWKEGYTPFMNYWDGGPQAYMNNRLMLGHFIKNYRLMFEHGIHPQGSYNDVFGYIPPDDDFNPEHPTTHTESIKFRASVLNWARVNLGIVGTEAGADWTIPYVDYTTSRFNRNPSSGNDTMSQHAIQVPLYELVYHDAVVTMRGADELRGWLHANAPGLGWGGMPADRQELLRTMKLHKRVGAVEMTNHEFLNEKRTRERTTFADGTTVTVDWDRKTVEVKPEL